MRFNKDGILLADVPNTGVVNRDTNARSGNPNHDSASGKFGGGSSTKKTAAAPANVDPRAFARMRDAVREAARSFKGDLSAENIQSFINKRASNPASVNIQQFAQLVQQQHIDDIVDLLGNQRGGIKISAPRGYLKKVLGGLTDDDVAEITARLEAMGVKDPHLVAGKHIDNPRIPSVTKKHEAIKAVTASDQFDLVPDAVEFDFQEGYMSDQKLEEILLALKDIPAPQVEVKPEIHVQVPAPQAMKVTPVRDNKGVILYTIQEPVDAR